MPDIAEDRRAAFALAEAGEPGEAAAIVDALVAAPPRPRRAACRPRRPRAHRRRPRRGPGRAHRRRRRRLPRPRRAPRRAALRAARRRPALAALAAEPAPAPPAPVPAPVTMTPRSRPGLRRQHRLEPGRGAARAALRLPRAPDGPVLPRRGRRPPPTTCRRALAARPRRRQPRRPLRQPRPRPLQARARRRSRSSPTSSTAAARAADLDYGLADRLLFPAPTLGNSSTAITAGALWRSLPRAAMTRPDGTGPLRLWQNAAANQLTVYPGAPRLRRGARRPLPGQHPLPPRLARLLGLRPAVPRGGGADPRRLPPRHQGAAAEAGLIVPTVQMVFRRSLRPCARATTTSAAPRIRRPSTATINAARMVSLANAIEADAIPPQVRLAVLEEKLGPRGVDFFGDGLSEQLFDTPAAVARVWRSSACRRILRLRRRHPRPERPAARLRLAAAAGRPREGEIEPMDDGRDRAHHPRLARPLPDLRGRPDAAARDRHRGLRQERRPRQRPGDPQLVLPAERGAQLRARPGRCPAHRRHRPRRPGPRATPTRCWCRAPTGATTSHRRRRPLTGWTRSRDGGATEDFTADGARILERDAAGRPLRGRGRRLPARPRPAGRLVVEELSTGERIDYQP